MLNFSIPPDLLPKNKEKVTKKNLQNLDSTKGKLTIFVSKGKTDFRKNTRCFGLTEEIHLTKIVF